MKTIEFVPSIDDAVRAVIEQKLVEIETRNDVVILFAVESGSRAWGFLDLSRNCSPEIAPLGCLSFEGQGTFPVQC